MSILYDCPDPRMSETLRDGVCIVMAPTLRVLLNLASRNTGVSSTVPTAVLSKYPYPLELPFGPHVCHTIHEPGVEISRTARPRNVAYDISLIRPTSWSTRVTGPPADPIDSIESTRDMSRIP